MDHEDENRGRKEVQVCEVVDRSSSVSSCVMGPRENRWMELTMPTTFQMGRKKRTLGISH